ncbi:NAD(P)H-binding protein [Streptomyces sp. NPDC051569]|uniref:NAD(P)H-binding protein n=1 Tax=Streptomyces sp. NPDC051569 TaxID=3365661 RepID=UPI00379EFF9A
MATVAIIGAHGEVGRLVLRALAGRGDTVLGVVRRDDQVQVINGLGGRGVLLDIESASAEELARAIAGADAIVFSAGAGAGSGAARKRTVDYGGSVLSVEAARLAGINRFVQVSGVGVDDPVAPGSDASWTAYVSAKSDADRELRGSGLDWTVLRPGPLTDAPGSGTVRLAERTGSGAIARQDVAALVVACLDDGRSIGKQWEARGGDTPVAQAVATA